MDNVKLFAWFAGNNLNIWEKTIGTKIIHKAFGDGKITEVYKSDNTVYIKCYFNDTTDYEKYKIFIVKTFEEGFIKDMILPNEFNLKFLLIKRREFEKKIIEDEKERLENERLKQQRLLARREQIEKAERLREEEKDKEYLRLIKVMRDLKPDNYVNHCYNCGEDITTEMIKCNKCGWYICDWCRACGCRWHPYKY